MVFLFFYQYDCTYTDINYAYTDTQVRETSAFYLDQNFVMIPFVDKNLTKSEVLFCTGQINSSQLRLEGSHMEERLGLGS